MPNDKHSRTEQRAREIWEREGKPEGRAETHWRQAEEELAHEEREQNAAAQPGSQPYVPVTEATIEPTIDTPVVAGVSIPETPPLATEQLKKEQPASRAASSREWAAPSPKAAETAKPGPGKAAEEKKPHASKKAEAESKKGAAKKKG
jgi:hypothetical protein